MSQGTHEEWEDWKAGDWIVWNAGDDDKTPHQITRIDAYGRVFWLENGQERMTRATNMERVSDE